MLCDYIISLIKTHRYRILSIILDNLITPDVVNKRKETPLFMVTRNLSSPENRKMARFLIEKGANFLRQHSITGFTPAVEIVQCQDVVNKRKETPLFMVTRNLSSPENRKMARFLIEKGANFLRQHSITGFTPAVEIVQCQDQDLIDFLLSKLTNINAPLDSVGGTVLHHAARCGNQSTVLKLLKRGANPNQKNVVGNTPIHEAVISKGYNVLKLLVDHGGDINKIGVGGKRPLHMVAYSRFKDITMDKVLECKPSLEAQDAEGNTPLCYFVTNFEDRVQEIEKLLDSGCDPNVTDHNGMNLLHVIARRKTRRRISDNLKSIVDLLVQYGIDLNAQTTEEQNTPLHLAIMNNNDLVATLLSNSASLFLRNSKGQTPFDTAIIELRIGAVLALLPFAILWKISEKDLINVSGEGEVARETLMGFVTKDTLQRCRKEQQILQNIKLKFYPSVSCCDLLYISEKEFADLLRYANFRKSFRCDLKLFKESRFYRFTLKEKLKSAQRLRHAQDEVIKFLYSINRLPLLCIERIVYFMDKNELFRLQIQIEKSKKIVHAESGITENQLQKN